MPDLSSFQVKINCKYYRGDLPCKPHKEYGCHCDNCSYFKEIKEIVLIIKLGAIGDVIRTTPLLRRLKTEYPNCYIYWLTYSPEILSDNWVDRILPVNIENIELLKNIAFDWLINLDKDSLAISLASMIKASKKSGFTLDEYGHAKAIANDSEKHKWLTGIFNDISKTNSKHYVQEIFEICGYEFAHEEYILNYSCRENSMWQLDYNKKIIGLNTGCGGRWTSRLWPNENWNTLANDLLAKGYEVILLGGEQEDARNKEIASATGAKYFGFFPLNDFISLLSKCDLVVTAVTMAMHLVIGLKKKIVLFNNIFNKHEFYLYGLGDILEPDFKCDCYYSSNCKNNCMQYIYPKTVLECIEKKLLK